MGVLSHRGIDVTAAAECDRARRLQLDVTAMMITAFRLVDLGSPLSLTVLWLVLGSVFFVLVRKLRRDGGFGNEQGL